MSGWAKFVCLDTTRHLCIISEWSNSYVWSSDVSLIIRFLPHDSYICCLLVSLLCKGRGWVLQLPWVHTHPKKDEEIHVLFYFFPLSPLFHKNSSLWIISSGAIGCEADRERCSFLRRIYSRNRIISCIVRIFLIQNVIFEVCIEFIQRITRHQSEFFWKLYVHLSSLKYSTEKDYHKPYTDHQPASIPSHILDFLLCVRLIVSTPSVQLVTVLSRFN